MIALWGHRGYCGSSLMGDGKYQGVSHRDWHSFPGSDISQFSALIWSAGWPGKTNIDDVEVTPHRSKLQNVWEPLEVASRFADQGKRMLFFSSGCLFDGAHSSGRPWRENDEPNFTSPVYHSDKLEMEKRLGQFGELVTIFRFRLPFDSRIHPRNMVAKIKEWPAVMDIDQSWTWLPDLKRAVNAWANGRIDGGVWHVVQPGFLNNYDAALSLNSKVKKIEGPLEAYTGSKCIRSHAKLDCDKLQSVMPLTQAAEAWEMACREFIMGG